MLANKLANWLLILRDLFSYKSQINNDNLIIIYSEGINTWAHLKTTLNEILAQEEWNVLYITSSISDPGRSIKHSRLTNYYLGNGHVINYFFQTAKASIFISSSPDLEISKFKKSKAVGEYIYIPHSICSLHMIYKKDAFNYFDAVCCVGPHHEKGQRGKWPPALGHRFFQRPHRRTL